MKKYFYFLLLTILIQYTTYPQGMDYLRYLPLKVGNVWVYVEHYGYPYYMCNTYHRYKITDTTQINGKTYYQVTVNTAFNLQICEQGVPNLYSRLYSNMHIRMDTLSGNIYINETCGNTPGVLMDSLKSRKGDSATTCVGGSNIHRETCSDTSSATIFGMNRKTKTYSIPHASGNESQSYAMDIGMYYSFWGESTVWWSETLLGCVIDGIVHGDTTLIVGINNEGKEIPETYNLCQNYPNPFNPVTRIKFSIPYTPLSSMGEGLGPSRLGSDEVRLTVYDILGREIAALVNEPLSPGTYEVEWDGSNYPSGVYFYKLITENYSETRKMVLVK